MPTSYASGTGSSPASTLPAGAGIGFKGAHFDALMADAFPPAFIEIHAENYLGAGGLPHAQLDAIAGRLPVSVHGVGLSIGGESPLDERHLERIAALLDRHPAAVFSEHLAWSSHDGVFFNDLLPVRYDRATLDRVCRHVDRVQARLARPLLLENPSTYLRFDRAELDEAEFLTWVVERTGCGLLLDLNNAFVSAHNHGEDVMAFLRTLPLASVYHCHLAGHVVDAVTTPTLLIDDHGSEVCEPVWALHAWLVDTIGPVPTLIEWDTDVPAYAVLREQARRAQVVLDAAAARSRGVAA